MTKPTRLIPLLIATALVAAATAAILAGVVLVFPYRAPSVCSNKPCDAIGVIVFLPNFDRVDVQVSGPAPGVDYLRAGAPSNFVQR